MNMRKKSTMQSGGGYSNNKKRYTPGGGSNGGSNNHSYNNNHNRPRKNYGAAREKYLSQARDALAAGDRVLAENFYQHADHCYRMMMEEGHHQRHQQQQNQQAQAEAAQGENQGENQTGNQNDAQPDTQDHGVGNASALPAFLTGTYQPAATGTEPPAQQEWEE